MALHIFFMINTLLKLDMSMICQPPSSTGHAITSLFIKWYLPFSFSPTHIKWPIIELKIKPFVKVEDGFDDLFQGMDSFSEIIKYASSQLSQDNFEAFQAYINKRLEKFPLNFLTIEDENKHTPSVSLDDEVKYMPEDESGQS